MTLKNVGYVSNMITITTGRIYISELSESSGPPMPQISVSSM